MSLLESLKRPFTHTLALFLVLLATGLPLAVLYTPTAVSAAESIRTITFIAPYGWLLRNLHYWATVLLLLAITLQLLLVLFTGHSRPPQRRNWLWGLAALLLSGLLAFSGSVLRWDVETVGALTAVANLLRQTPFGGAEITDATVGRLYLWHVVGLSAPLLLLLGWQHLKSGAIPRISQREGVVLLALLCLLMGLALWVDAPLAPAVLEWGG